MNAQRYGCVKVLFATLAWFLLLLFQITTSSDGLSRPRNNNSTKPATQRCSVDTVSEVLTNLTSASRGYNPRIRPNYGGDPVKINVSYAILAIREIRETDMTYVVDMYFRQQWLDERLKHSLNCTLTFMTGTKHPADFIWVGDAYFENAVTSYMHNVLTNNHKIDIHPNGTVFWVARVTTKALCPMNLETYPFDVQVCGLTTVSYTYPTEHLQFAWENNSGVTFFHNKELSQFTISDTKTIEKDSKYLTGTYSTLNAYFTFERRLGYFIIQVYTPCMFLVVLAGFSFWIDPRATPARVALSLTTLLTTATIWGAINSNLPKVSYIKAIDIYFATSFVFVFLTLLQYIILLILRAKMCLRKTHNTLDENTESKEDVHNNFDLFKSTENFQASQSTLTNAFVLPTQYSGFDGDLVNCGHGTMRRKTEMKTYNGCKFNHREEFDQEVMQQKDLKYILWLDEFSRFIYLLCYLIFNLVYWFTYYRK